jgi:hypothetical protein
MLTEERKGAIALAAFKRKLRNEGVRVGPHLHREIPQLAKDLNVPEDELREFMETVVRELVDETFAPKK